MAVVRPFRAVRYAVAEAGALETLVAPPYDVLSPEQRAEHASRSQYNVVHLTLPRSEEDAARTWREWHASGVLARDDEPAYWALEQDYTGPDAVPRTRTGLVASLRVEPYERRIVLPHERTHRGPKEGRLRLLRAVGAHLEPIFLLYEGERPFEAPEGRPEIEVEGARLWRLPAGDAVAAAFADRQLLIADGHHRYETALAYHGEVRSEDSAFLPVVLVGTDDPGLTIFPTHRIAARLNGRAFPPATSGDPLEALRELERSPRDRSGAVVYRRGGAATLEGEAGELDVQLVERYAPEVSYTAIADEAIAAVDEGDAEAAFLLRPLRIEDIFAGARRGDVMPQKSTYFYPKLLSGLFFQPA